MSDKNWFEYNESLIERGYILMDIGFVKSKKKELVKMNKMKVGRPVLYRDSYIQFLVFIKTGFSIIKNGTENCKGIGRIYQN